MSRISYASIFISLCLTVCAIARAATGPVASPATPPIPAPVDRPFQGAIQLAVDATDTSHGIFRVMESIPVQSSGDLVLLYPEWETTSHSATVSVLDLAGLHMQSDGHELPWRRDSANVHAFHVTLPSGAHTLSLQFVYLPRSSSEIRPQLIVVQWQRLLLYPAGWYARDLPVAASLSLPPDLHAFTALKLAQSQAGTGGNADSSTLRTSLAFKPETLDRLIDAPVYAGRSVQQVDLRSAPNPAVHLDLVADAASDLALVPATLASLEALIPQTEKVFGRPPFSHYEMLVSLSDELSPGGGQEHLEEGENNLPAHFLTDYAHQLNNRDLIAHEYVHAWNGRSRQPVGLWSPAFNQPVDPSLLWVYEGQTEFWGRVLAARAHLRTRQETLDKLALDAAFVSERSGREWKNLADSSLDALYMPGHSPTWPDWQRREDYYQEGVLLWLDVDARLRELSRETVGLDDFARKFFASNGPSEPASTYTFVDVCKTLNALASDDWTAFLNQHLQSHDTQLVLAGLARAGWRLAYAPAPTQTFLQYEEEAGITDFTSSIGLQIRNNGIVRSVAWSGPAFQAGLRPGVAVTEVNTTPFTPAALRSAIEHSPQSPVHLSIRSHGSNQAVAIPYAGPLRYPLLERIPGKPDRLTPLLHPR